MGHAVVGGSGSTKSAMRGLGYLLAFVATACGLNKWAFSSSQNQQANTSAKTHSSAAGGSNSNGGSGNNDNNGSLQTPYRMFGAKTSYQQVCEKTVQQISVPGCEPKQFWLLSRHGARYPGPLEMSRLITCVPRLREAIVQNFEKGKGSLTKEQIDVFRTWKMELRADQDNQLTPEGEKEVRGLAERFKLRFPSLLGRDFTVENYHFRHTDSDRTADSARLFASELFGRKDVCIPMPLKDDPVIKFYKTCRKWIEEVNENLDSREERKRFRQGPEMQKVIDAVSVRLGFDKTLSFESVHLMFAMCRFDSVLHPEKTSPWCTIFLKNEVEVMEYDEDLEYYWTDGYGFPINYEQACPPIKDFVEHFRAVMKEDSRTPLGVFRFSHSGMLLKVYARMGLFRDEVAPRADNFELQTARQWRASLIDPFTANLALVLFKCGSRETENYKLMAFVQEHPVILPGCKDLMCPMSVILKTYAPLADQCDVATICGGLDWGDSPCSNKEDYSNSHEARHNASLIRRQRKIKMRQTLDSPEQLKE